MNFVSLLLIFQLVVVGIDGNFGFSFGSFFEVWRKFTGDPCPEKLEMRKSIINLQTRLSQSLIGQRLVEMKLVAMMESHLSGHSPKPLVISMHGWTGCGKNFVTQILVETLYDRGFDNSNVHLFSGRLHFPLSTKEAISEYKVNLHNWIRGNVSRCGLSTFIFDEIDKVPVEVIDAIKPYLDYHSALNGVDYRNAIFIFISNVGGNLITKKYLELWEQGQSRDKMDYKEFEPILRKILYNMAGAFEKSSILEDHLISLYLPFLPMEKYHVSTCIKREMGRQNIIATEKGIDYVLNSIEFYNDRLSVSGCKRVSDQVSMLKYVEKDEL